MRRVGEIGPECSRTGKRSENGNQTRGNKSSSTCYLFIGVPYIKETLSARIAELIRVELERKGSGVAVAATFVVVVVNVVM